MEDYKTHLTLLQSEAVGRVDLSAPQSVEYIVKQVLGDREKKQWRVSLLGNNVKIREQAERLAKFLLWSDSVVKTAFSAQPYAALAWSGVSLLLPLLTKNITQNEAMLKGFNLIGDIQMYWRICEDTFLRSDHQQRYEDLVKSLAGLYSHIIEYQARVICHLSSAHLSRTWQNVTVWNDWAGKAKHIDGQSERCKDYISPPQEREVLERWKCQIQEMQQSRTILQEIHQALEDGGRRTRRYYDDPKERDLLQHIDSDYEHYKNFNPQKVKGTCEWFFNDDRFRKWRDSNRSSLLWVSAGPGCGKSVLSRALIDERRLSTNITTSTVCYFFFKDGDERRMHSTNALCAILHQLLTQDSSGNLIKNALASHRSYGAGLAQNFSELWRIMVGCAGSSDTGEVVVILDALDECEKNSRDQLIDKLKDFYRDQHNLSKTKLKFLITSRPYGDIEKYFGGFPGTNYLRFEGDDKSADISREIDLVIDERVNHVASHLAADDQRKLSDHLKGMENRTYLWLHLIFDVIEGELSQYTMLPNIERLLSDIPARTCEAYEKILGRSQDEVQTEMLLRIVLAAGRPLTLNEANFALTLAMKEERFPSSELLESELGSNQAFKDTVQSLVGPFISVYDSRLYFIHQTAREFLIYSKRHGKWEGRLNMAKSHNTMSLICLHYLLLPDLVCLPEDREHSFLPYAAAHWPWHYLSQEDAVADKSRKDARMLCHVDGKQVRAWVPWHRWKSTYPFKRIHWSDFGSGFGSDLALASYLGLKWVVEDILAEEKTDVNTPRKPGGTALQAASRRGHEEIAQMLLDKNPDGNMLNEFEMTALYAASAGGHKEIVRMLLDKTADASTLNDFEMTALYAASAHGHKDIVLMLLDHNADHSGPRKSNKTAPHAAPERDHKETAQVLLDHKADVDMRDSRYMAARAASYNGHKDVAQLLDKKANATTPS